jgi:hypothetical protein
MKIFKSQLNLRAGADWGTFDFLGYLWLFLNKSNPKPSSN